MVIMVNSLFQFWYYQCDKEYGENEEGSGSKLKRMKRAELERAYPDIPWPVVFEPHTGYSNLFTDENTEYPSVPSEWQDVFKRAMDCVCNRTIANYMFSIAVAKFGNYLSSHIDLGESAERKGKCLRETVKNFPLPLISLFSKNNDKFLKNREQSKTLINDILREYRLSFFQVISLINIASRLSSKKLPFILPGEGSAYER